MAAMASSTTTSSVRSTPGPATRTPMHLGLGAATAPRRAVPSLSIKTADGSRVSILNDSDEGAMDAADQKRCSSVPGLSPAESPASASPFRAQSTPGAGTPVQLPAMLPSLSTLVQAVRMVSPPPASAARATTPALRRSISTSSTQHPYHPAGTKSTGKRKYKCVFDGCGKAFTTSGHLARHQRIHTGEKNFSCLFPGCASRFSRQDNMMQHYRTHLSSKSRRNASPRKVMFVETGSSDPCRPAHSMYPGQVFGGSHPIQHQHQHHPYGPLAARPSAAGMAPPSSQQQMPPQQQQAPVAASHRAAGAHCGLPPVHMFSGPGGAGAGGPPPPHEYRGGMAKQSPAIAHPGTMAFY